MNRKIEILTGSHCCNSEFNKEQFDKINDLLLSRENPLFNKFNKEQFYLDDCDGFISIVKSSNTVKDLSSLQFDKLRSYLKKFIKMDGLLFIGSLCENY